MLCEFICVYACCLCKPPRTHCHVRPATYATWLHHALSRLYPAIILVHSSTGQLGYQEFFGPVGSYLGIFYQPHKRPGDKFDKYVNHVITVTPQTF